MSAQLFARGFDELEVGERFASRGRTITEADVVLFASLTYVVTTCWKTGSTAWGTSASGMAV